MPAILFPCPRPPVASCSCWLTSCTRTQWTMYCKHRFRHQLLYSTSMEPIANRQSIAVGGATRTGAIPTMSGRTRRDPKSVQAGTLSRCRRSMGRHGRRGGARRQRSGPSFRQLFSTSHASFCRRTPPPPFGLTIWPSSFAGAVRGDKPAGGCAYRPGRRDRLGGRAPVLLESEDQRLPQFFNSIPKLVKCALPVPP